MCLRYYSTLCKYAPPNDTQSNLFVNDKEFWLGILLSDIK